MAAKTKAPAGTPVVVGPVPFADVKTDPAASLDSSSVLEQLPDAVLFLRYEELLRDPDGNIRDLARFVGLPFSDAEEEAGVVQDIVKLCSFGHLKPLEANSTGKVDPLVPVLREALSRKGVAGDWVNYMTPEMARRMDEIVADKIHATGLTFQ